MSMFISVSRNADRKTPTFFFAMYKRFTDIHTLRHRIIVKRVYRHKTLEVTDGEFNSGGLSKYISPDSNEFRPDVITVSCDKDGKWLTREEIDKESPFHGTADLRSLCGPMRNMYAHYVNRKGDASAICVTANGTQVSVTFFRDNFPTQDQFSLMPLGVPKDKTKFIRFYETPSGVTKLFLVKEKPAEPTEPAKMDAVVMTPRFESTKTVQLTLYAPVFNVCHDPDGGIWVVTQNVEATGQTSHAHVSLTFLCENSIWHTTHMNFYDHKYHMEATCVFICEKAVRVYCVLYNDAEEFIKCVVYTVPYSHVGPCHVSNEATECEFSENRVITKTLKRKLDSEENSQKRYAIMVVRAGVPEITELLVNGIVTCAGTVHKESRIVMLFVATNWNNRFTRGLAQSQNLNTSLWITDNGHQFFQRAKFATDGTLQAEPISATAQFEILQPNCDNHNCKVAMMHDEDFTIFEMYLVQPCSAHPSKHVSCRSVFSSNTVHTTSSMLNNAIRAVTTTFSGIKWPW